MTKNNRIIDDIVRMNIYIDTQKTNEYKREKDKENPQYVVYVDEDENMLTDEKGYILTE